MSITVPTAVTRRPYTTWIAGLALVGAVTVATVATLRGEPATAASPEVTFTPVEVTPSRVAPPIEAHDVATPTAPKPKPERARQPRRERRSAAASSAPLALPPPPPDVPALPNPQPTDLDAPLPH